MLFQERPLGRRVIKLASSLLGPWSHAHAWFPYLRLESGEDGLHTSITYRGKKVASIRSAEILRAALGRQIYVVGSGPSVLENDLGLLEERSALLLNGAIAEIGGRIASPLAVVIEDERFIWRHFEMMNGKIAAGTICLFSPAVIRALCEKDPGWLQDKEIILVDDIRKPYGKPRQAVDQLRANPAVRLNQAGTAGFSREPNRGVFQGGSVAISAVQFAAYARPAAIGFIGIDISNASQPRFYETPGDVAPSGLQRAAQRISDHLKLAIEECRELEIQIENYSKQSILATCGLPYNSGLRKEPGAAV